MMEMRTSGTSEPWVKLDGQDISREECFAAFTKAETGAILTKEEARLAAVWLVHPLNTPLALTPYGIAGLLLRRQVALI